MATIQKSRFAALPIDDDIEETKSKTKPNNASNNQPQAAKKKNRKKKKADQNKADTEELRNLAFGGKSSGKKRSTPPSGAGEPAPQQQWKEWRQVDEEVVQDEYEKDLQKALMESRLEMEEKKEVLSAVADQNGTNEKKGRKKKKDNKPAAMSLETFNQMEQPAPKKSADSDDSEEEILPAKPQLVTEVSEPDPTFFDNVKKDVAKTIRKERIQEEYKKQYAMESVLSHQYREDLAQKDESIKQLKKANKELKTELKQAKERTQQLCQILAQGEMKTKADVLRELDELRRLHEELNQQVAQLSQSLEQERSKNHALTSELTAKQKGKK